MRDAVSRIDSGSSQADRLRILPLRVKMVNYLQSRARMRVTNSTTPAMTTPSLRRSILHPRIKSRAEGPGADRLNAQGLSAYVGRDVSLCEVLAVPVAVRTGVPNL